MFALHPSPTAKAPTTGPADPPIALEDCRKLCHCRVRLRAARVVYIDPKNPLHCGIELDEPRNIWGVSVPPDNWEETADLETED
jgi:hypothetical protein